MMPPVRPLIASVPDCVKLIPALLVRSRALPALTLKSVPEAMETLSVSVPEAVSTSDELMVVPVQSTICTPSLAPLSMQVACCCALASPESAPSAAIASAETDTITPTAPAIGAKLTTAPPIRARRPPRRSSRVLLAVDGDVRRLAGRPRPSSEWSVRISMPPAALSRCSPRASGAAANVVSADESVSRRNGSATACAARRPHARPIPRALPRSIPRGTRHSSSCHCRRPNSAPRHFDHGVGAEAGIAHPAMRLLRPIRRAEPLAPARADVYSANRPVVNTRAGYFPPRPLGHLNLKFVEGLALAALHLCNTHWPVAVGLRRGHGRNSRTRAASRADWSPGPAEAARKSDGASAA